MRTKLLTICFAIFAVIGCEKAPEDPDFSKPAGHVYNIASGQLPACFLDFMDDSHLKILRRAAPGESPSVIYEDWGYSLSADGKTITFHPKTVLSLGCVAEDVLSMREYKVKETATFNGDEIIWYGTVEYFYVPGSTPSVERFVFKAKR